MNYQTYVCHKIIKGCMPLLLCDKDHKLKEQWLKIAKHPINASLYTQLLDDQTSTLATKVPIRSNVILGQKSLKTTRLFLKIQRVILRTRSDDFFPTTVTSTPSFTSKIECRIVSDTLRGSFNF